jgi:hypothetical protein
MFPSGSEPTCMALLAVRIGIAGLGIAVRIGFDAHSLVVLDVMPAGRFARAPAISLDAI